MAIPGLGVLLLGISMMLASPCTAMGNARNADDVNLPSSEGRDWRKSFEGPEVYNAQIALRVSENEARKGKLSVARILVDNAGNIILCHFSDGGGLFKYAPNGKTIFRVDNLKNHTADPNSCGFVEGDPDSLVMSEPSRMGADGKHVIFVDKEGKVSNYRDKNYKSLRRKKAAYVDLIHKGEEWADLVIKNYGSNKEIARFSMEYQEGLLFDSTIIGKDREGNFYFVANFKRPYEAKSDPKLFLIQKFSKKGELLTRIWSPLSDPVWPHPDRIFAVDLEGSIYQIWWNDEYYYVIEWTR